MINLGGPQVHGKAGHYRPAFLTFLYEPIIGTVTLTPMIWELSGP